MIRKNIVKKPGSRGGISRRTLHRRVEFLMSGKIYLKEEKERSIEKQQHKRSLIQKTFMKRL